MTEGYLLGGTGSFVRLMNAVCEDDEYEEMEEDDVDREEVSIS